MDDTAVDLAILGAGAAGMMTALVGARHGLKVVVFDPHFSQPNNLFISGGLFPAAGSRLQTQAGVSDDARLRQEHHPGRGRRHRHIEPSEGEKEEGKHG